MNSPASSAASKRSSATASSAERTTARSSFGAVSMAWVYMVVPLRVSMIDNAAGLADERAFDAVRRAHAHRRADTGQRLDRLLQVAPDGGGIGTGLRGQQLAQHLDLVEEAVARHDELVLA